MLTKPAGTKTILVRTDANTALGMGHLSRCLTLSSALMKMGAAVEFYMTAPSQAVADWVASLGCGLQQMPEGLDQAQDLELLLKRAGEMRAAGLVIDGYQFSQKYINGAAGSLCTLFFDELMDMDLKVALILNQNFYADQSAYRMGGGTRLLLGAKYAVLRDEFVTARRQMHRIIPPRAEKLFINFGGSDPSNLTTKGLQGLKQAKNRYQIKVVLGALNPFSDEVRREVEQSPHDIEVLTNIGNMAQVMAWADLALSASGTTTLEMACMGLPSVLVIQVDNQRLIGQAMGRRGLATQLGWWRDVTGAMMARAVDELADSADERGRQSRGCLDAVDGKGAERVAEAILAASRDWTR